MRDERRGASNPVELAENNHVSGLNVGKECVPSWAGGLGAAHAMVAVALPLQHLGGIECGALESFAPLASITRMYPRCVPVEVVISPIRNSPYVAQVISVWVLRR